MPFLALARPFVAAGHRVSFLTNSNWQDLVAAIGAKFHPIADEDPPQDRRNNYLFFKERIYPSFARCYKYIAQKSSSGSSCAVIYRLNMLGAECAAARFNLPNIKVALQPAALQSVERPPWPLTSLAYGSFGGFNKAWVIPLLFRAADALSGYRRLSNRFRQSIGMTTVPFQTVPSGKEDLLLMLCPSWFANPQKDWPPTCRYLGFAFDDQGGGENPKELVEFISRHGKPLVFTAGTGVDDTESFFQDALKICELLKLPGVLLGRNPEKRSSICSQPILRQDYAELTPLLRHARALVHHGGIGTAAQAVRAGIPQIVIPRQFDQPDNALRVATLGLGAALFKRVPPSQTAEILKQVMHSAEIARQLKIAAGLIDRSDIPSKAYLLISELLDRRFANGSVANATRPNAMELSGNGVT